MGLMHDVQPVFDFLSQTFGCLPLVLRLLVTGVFGSFVLIAVMQFFKG